jgi:enamine deaminase RidA (YjgF/YER057c/UK114 family)
MKRVYFPEFIKLQFFIIQNIDMERINYSSGAKWEDIVGYSRAVKIGNIIEVTGTVAVDENNQLVGGDSAYEQTRFVISKIEQVLKKAGASLNDVIRTRIFVTDISRWEEYGRAHGEFFGSIKPCTTMVEVSKLIDKLYLVEIEASAVLPS